MLRTSAVRLGGQDYLVPNTDYDIFAKPNMDNEPAVDQYTDSFKSATLNQVSLNTSDLLLASSLNSLHQLKTKRNKKYVTVMTDNKLQQDLLNTIQLYPAQYKGQITPETTAACQLVAGQLKDTYDLNKRTFTRNAFLNNDYLGIIAYENTRGNGLAAFGPSWVLPAVAEYVGQSLNYDSVRTAALREELLHMNPRISQSGEPYIDWTNDPGILPDQFINTAEEPLLATGKIKTAPEPKLVQMNQLRIYQFYDQQMLDSKGHLTPLYMIFAPINADEMERILLYLNRNIKMYSFWHSLAVEDLPVSAGKDFKYLFPVELSYVGNYTVFSSSEISEERLMHIYHLQEIPFAMPRIEDIRGTYATYLLAEALFYEFEVWWNQGQFMVGLAGWIQAHDIYEQLGLILNDINRENMRFVKLESYMQAVQYADQTNAKCFYYLGNYYAALNEEVAPDLTQQPSKKPVDNAGLLESINPLRAVVQPAHKRTAKKYLESLGYDISPNPETYYIDLQLGHRTYQIEDKQLTSYYYESTHNQELEVYQIEGPNQAFIKRQLEKLLQQGYFFDQKTQNITRGYPDFVPSYAPLKRNLNL